MSDSFSIRLPEEPFDVLMRLFSLHNLDFYQENASNSAEAMQYLRKFLASLKPAKGMKTRSQRAVENDDYGCYIPEERFEPMPSQHARCETPRPGSNDFRASLDKSYSTFLKPSEVNIRPVKVPLLEEPAVNFETTLNVTLSLTRETATEVKKLLQATAALSRPRPSYKNRFLDHTLRPDSLPLPHFSVESGPFMPIFPRKRMPGHGHVKPQEKEKKLLLDTAKAVSGSPPSSMARLSAKLSSVKVEDDDELDLLKEDMMVMDGWQTYHSSPERPSSSTSSSVTAPHSSQEYDQLGLTISSPNTELTPIKLLKDSRMDLPAIPRSKRFGSDPKRPSRKGLARRRDVTSFNSYAAFLLNALNQSSTFTAPTSSPILDFDEPEAEPKVESKARAE
ncbi:hypothetical protein BT96DRAFT_1009088 [Gymnopus androsaceus JB14]|uniref:Uncharacterized protein n=1 Tax=Gymnopus androsaceus JB14 TaxID=1447944 RepID=A0A6A4GDL4_9AGAR|nr:hypothetical protein BT96DRAFT_1009088 [Gymnopus androsaceus JB14]